MVPGFNGGWMSIMGPVGRNGGTTGNLVSLGPSAAYRDPKFSWAAALTPTSLHFLPTDILGQQYTNDLFVGTDETGSLFRFELTANRRNLVLTGDLADRVADNSEADLLGEQSGILFGSGFGVITDVTSTAQGLFVLSLDQGTLYRISQVGGRFGAPLASPAPVAVPEPGVLAPLALGAMLLLRRRLCPSTRLAPM